MEGRQTFLQKLVSRVGGGSSGRWRPLAAASLASLRCKLSTTARAIVLSLGVEILDPEDFTMSRLLLHLPSAVPLGNPSAAPSVVGAAARMTWGGYLPLLGARATRGLFRN